MDYVACFRPNKELLNLILKQDNIVSSTLGFHATLCFFHMDSEQEKNLICDLSKIKITPFKTKTQSFEYFHNNILVLTLSRPDELFQLHKNIVQVVRNYASSDFDEMEKQFSGDNYKPHITISRSTLNFNKTNELLNQESFISEYYLFKKVDGVWKEIKSFN
ncbi:MAG: 2'-5' RNA ligase family protein [archaeon]